MFGQLVPAGGGMPFALVTERVIVGRDPSCDIVVPSRRISGRHCELTLRNGYWWVRDLDSRNGTGVNGKRITKKRILPRQVLCIPKMRFRLEYTAPDSQRNTSDDSLALEVLNAVDPEATASTVLETSDPGGGIIRDLPVATDSSLSQDRPRTPAPAPAPAPAPQRPSDPVKKSYLGKLVPSGGGDPIPMLEPRLIVGRSRDCEIRIKQSTISGRHCLLTWEDGFWFVEDLNSSNGIRVNSEKVDRRILMPGDRLSISKRHFEIDYVAEGEPPRDMNVLSKSLLEKAGLQNLMGNDEKPRWITSHEEADDTPRKYTLTDEDP